MRTLTVFVISYLFDPRIRGGMGGSQKVLELASRFADLHRVTLFLPSYSRQDSGLDCVWLPVTRLPWVRLVLFNLLLVPAVLWRALRARPRVLYQRVFNGLTPPLLASLLRARLVIEFNGSPLQFHRAAGRSTAWMRRLLAWSLKRAYRVVSLTEGLRRELTTEFGVDPRRIVVIPSGSNPDVFHPRSRPDCRRRLGIPVGEPVAVFAGTFFAYQGIELVLEALAHPQLRRLRLYLLGDGVLRTPWERQAAAAAPGRVTFTGQVGYDSVAEHIGAADFCLAPFRPDRGEVSPLKVLDYLFCARPTVIARIGPVENLLAEFPSLVAFTPGDAGSLAAAMRSVLEQPARLEALAAEDSRRARRLYSWEAIARTIERDCFN